MNATEYGIHQSMHCLLTQKNLQRKNTIFLEIITCDPSIYTVAHPDFSVSNVMEKCTIMG